MDDDGQITCVVEVAGKRQEIAGRAAAVVCWVVANASRINAVISLKLRFDCRDRHFDVRLDEPVPRVRF